MAFSHHLTTRPGSRQELRIRWPHRLTPHSPEGPAALAATCHCVITAVTITRRRKGAGELKEAGGKQPTLTEAPGRFPQGQATAGAGSVVVERLCVRTKGEGCRLQAWLFSLKKPVPSLCWVCPPHFL